MTWGPLLAGAVAGLASVPHCAAMCGPLAAFACGDRSGTRAGARGAAGAIVRYQLARAFGYATAGALLGEVGVAATGWLSAPVAQAVLSWTFAAGLGWAAWRLWKGALRGQQASAPVALSRSRAAAHKLRSPAIAIGALTTLLPCGALYAAFLLAAGSGGALTGAATMGAFALTSGLGLAGAGVLGRHLARLGPSARRGLAVVLALGAIVLALRPVDALRGQSPDQCHSAAGPPVPGARPS